MKIRTFCAKVLDLPMVDSPRLAAYSPQWAFPNWLSLSSRIRYANPSNLFTPSYTVTLLQCECVDLSFYETAIMQGYVDVFFRDVITDARYPAQSQFTQGKHLAQTNTFNIRILRSQSAYRAGGALGLDKDWLAYGRVVLTVRMQMPYVLVVLVGKG